MIRDFVAAIILALIILAGCGGSNRDAVVAKVGTKTITLGQVSDYDLMFRVGFESAEEEFEAKKRYVDSLIDVRLLTIGAYQSDLDIDKEVLDIMEIEKPRFLLDELFKRKILSKSSTTEAEVREHYERLKEEIHVKHILVAEKELADSLYEAITDGAEFEQLARDFSLDQSTAMNGGDLDYIRWGWLVDSFQEVVFALSPGQVSRPFETEMGWHIAKLVDRRETDPGSYEQMNVMLKAQIEDQKRQKVMMEYLEGLKERQKIKLDGQAVEIVLGMLNRLFPDTLGGKPFKKSTIDLELLEEYQKSQILAYFEGGEMTIEEYMKAIDKWPIKERPDFRDEEAVKAAIFNMHMDRILAKEAEAEGLDKTDTFNAVITQFKEAVMADKMQELVMNGTPEVVDDDIYEYYNSHPDQFEVDKRLRVREVLVGAAELAGSLRTAIDEGADLGEVAEEYTERPGMKPRNGDLGLIEPYRYPAIYKAAETMRVGEIKGPIRSGDNEWSIIELTGSEPPKTYPIEEVAEDIFKELTSKRQKETLENWLAARRAETSIEVDYDLIWETIDREKYEED